MFCRTHGVEDPAARIVGWAQAGEGRLVCIANVHVLMEAFDSPVLHRALNDADMTVPDGMPVVWMMRLKGARRQGGVYGPTLMRKTLERAASEGVAVGLYGSTNDVLDSLIEKISAKHPRLRVVFRESPPFGDFNSLQQGGASKRVAASGARILFAGLGCPQQELWMAAHRGRIPAVMVGVGDAFDFLAGTKRMAPRWMQSVGLEWLFRLPSEPRRLWKRYLMHNPRFVFLAVAELLGIWRSRC